MKTVQRYGLYRHRGRLGVVTSHGDSTFVFMTFDVNGALLVDVIDYEPEKVAFSWSDLKIGAPTHQVTEEKVQDALDRFCDYLLEYCAVDHYKRLSEEHPAWVYVDPNTDSVVVRWRKADVFETTRIFTKWLRFENPTVFANVENWRAVYDTLSAVRSVKLSLEDMLKMSEILRRSPTDHENVLFIQSVSTFVTHAIIKLTNTIGETVQ